MPLNNGSVRMRKKDDVALSRVGITSQRMVAGSYKYKCKITLVYAVK
jgi:hypothetical protein